MDQVEVEITGLAITARYGTLKTGTKLRTDAEFAKHLVEDCGAAKYTTPSPAKQAAAPAAKPTKQAAAKADKAAKAAPGQTPPKPPPEQTPPATDAADPDAGSDQTQDPIGADAASSDPAAGGEGAPA